MKHYLFCKKHLVWDKNELPQGSIGDLLVASKGAFDIDLLDFRLFFNEHGEDCEVTVKARG